jgi:hypothetical protein
MSAMSSGVFSPGVRNGQRVRLQVSGKGLRDTLVREDNDARIELIGLNRGYYEGTQYDEINADRLRELQGDYGVEKVKRLPEHERIHPYSTQIAECVDFIANQLTDGFTVAADDEAILELIDMAIDATDALRNDSDEELQFDALLIDAGVAGDTPFQTLWDPVEGTAYWEFYDAADVDFDVPVGSHVRKVTLRRTRIDTVLDEAGNEQEVEVRERVEWDLVNRVSQAAPVPFTPAGPAAKPDETKPAPTPNPAGTPAPPLELSTHRECRKLVYVEDQTEPVGPPEWLGLPFIPWSVVKADKRGINQFRGSSLITKNARETADRYNANEQLAYMIARYNSHGNLVVVGDQAYLKVEAEGHRIEKDVADVLTFPGGTAATVIALPTDPQMINHTHNVTSDAIYASFGLVRVEPDTLGGLGGVSGYALEILNRKSEGRLKRIRRTFKMDLGRMFDMMLDVTAYRQNATLDQLLAEVFAETPEEEVPAGLLADPGAWWDIDPEQVFPKRDIEIRMGSGYIVDDVSIRDDFTSGLISHEEALRQRGYSDPDIEAMMSEEFTGSSFGEGTLVDAEGNPVDATGAPIDTTADPFLAANTAAAKAKKKQQDLVEADKQKKADAAAGKAQGSTARK